MYTCNMLLGFSKDILDVHAWKPGRDRTRQRHECEAQVGRNMVVLDHLRKRRCATTTAAKRILYLPYDSPFQGWWSLCTRHGRVRRRCRQTKYSHGVSILGPWRGAHSKSESLKSMKTTKKYSCEVSLMTNLYKYIDIQVHFRWLSSEEL